MEGRDVVDRRQTFLDLLTHRFGKLGEVLSMMLVLFDYQIHGGDRVELLEQLEHVLSKQHAGRIRIDLLFLVGQSDLQVFVEIGGLLEFDDQKEVLSVEPKRDVNEATDVIRVTSTLVFDPKPMCGSSNKTRTCAVPRSSTPNTSRTSSCS